MGASRRLFFNFIIYTRLIWNEMHTLSPVSGVRSHSGDLFKATWLDSQLRFALRVNVLLTEIRLLMNNYELRKLTRRIGVGLTGYSDCVETLKDTKHDADAEI